MIKSLIINLKKALYEYIKNARGNFFCFLPGKLGRINSFFLRRIFSGIQMKQDQANFLKNLPKKSIIIFTTKYKSNFEFLFAHTRHKELGLPVPELAFDYNIYIYQPILRVFKVFISYIDYIICNRKIPNPYDNNYYEEKLMSSGCALLSLVEEKGFYLRFVKKRKDPLQYLIEIQKKISRPIYIVPQLMFFDRKPIPLEPSILDVIFGNSQRSGIIRKITTLLRYPDKIFVELDQAFDLNKWINQPDQISKKSRDQALALRRKLLFKYNRYCHTITGPSLKSREEVKETILTNHRMRIFMKKYAKEKKMPLQNVGKKADHYVNEIAARYNPALIKIMSHIINWIINSAFDGAVVDNEGLNKVKQMSRKGPILLVPCHKSHIDYLILSYVMYHNNMPCPHVAAGKNLSFWPLGPIFRGGGAFFIRRSFKGKNLYTKVLSEYVYKLLEEGFNIEMFIEGSRSRTGKLLTPKLGLISILIEALMEGACNDMFFVPVYIGYDRIIEEYAYIHETEGGNKRPENFFQVIKARKFLKKRYGKIYINFHDPISAKDLILDWQINKNSRNINSIGYREIGRRLITAIDTETVITPHGLTAAAILNLSQNRFNCKEIVNIANSYLFFAISQNAKIADTLVMSPDKALENAFIEYKHRKLIEEVHRDKEDKNSIQEILCTVKDNKRSLLEFYKNNCISYFVSGATVALAIFEKDAFQFCASDIHEHHKKLVNLFKYEFAVDREKPQEVFVRKTIKAFIDDAMLMPHKTIPDTYNITSSGYQKLKFYATFLKPYFESYLVVLKFFKKYNKEMVDFDIKEKAKKTQSIGSQMFKRGEIDLIESISKSNYLNGIKLFSEIIFNQNNLSLLDGNLKKYNEIIVRQLKLISK